MPNLLNNLSYLSYSEISKALFIFSAILVVIVLLRYLIIKRIATVADATKTDWDDAVIAAIERIGWPVYLVLPLYITSRSIVLPVEAARYIYWLTIVVVIVYGALSIEKLLTKFLKTVLRKRALDHGEEADKTVLNFSSLVLRVILWSVVLLLILQNLGYEVTALLGGIGVLGITLGFALQSILQDIFSFFSIYFDKPFQVGDFIEVDEYTGTVKRIGIKTTRIESLRGEEIVLSNKQLTETPLNNYKKMNNRRVEFEVGIEYDTPLKKVKKVPKLIEDIFKKLDDVEFERVSLSELGDSSVIFEIVYYVTDSDFALHKSIRQDINLGILESFSKEKISLAYPTQTIFLQK